MSAGISPGLNKLVNVIVCVGASVVIVGALFKIQHWAGSDILLPVGLLIEAGIFLVYAILPPPDAGQTQAPTAVTSPKAPAIDWDTFKVDLSKMSANFYHLIVMNTFCITILC